MDEFGLIGAIDVNHYELYGLHNFINNFPEINNVSTQNKEYIVHCMISKNKEVLGNLIKGFVENKKPNNIYFFNIKSGTYKKWSSDYLNKLISLYATKSTNNLDSTIS
jgi:hypothetical protein